MFCRNFLCWLDRYENPHFHESYKDDLLTYCELYGVTKDEVELLLDYGYDRAETEEMSFDEDYLRINFVKIRLYGFIMFALPKPSFEKLLIINVVVRSIFKVSTVFKVDHDDHCRFSTFSIHIEATFYVSCYLKK